LTSCSPLVVKEFPQLLNTPVKNYLTRVNPPYSFTHSLITASLLLSASVSNAQQWFFDLIANGRVESADEIVWTQEGPGNGGMSDLVRYHPSFPDTVFFGPDMGGNYQSDNNGTSWYNVRDYDGNSRMPRLRDVYYSSANSDRAIAIGFSHLWESSDRGKSWSLVLNCPWYTSSSDGSDGTNWVSKISAIGIDPNNSEGWYVGAGKHTRGQNWPTDSNIRTATAANPRGDSHSPSGQIWKTTDGGASWTEVSTGLDAAAQFCRIIVNPNNSSQVFAASNYGLYRTDNGGTSWTNITDGKLPNNTILDLDAYYDGANLTLYLIDQVRYFASGSTVTNTGGIYKSTDLGVTWQDITGNMYLDLNQLSVGVTGWGGIKTTYYNYLGRWFGIDASSAQTTYSVLPTDALQPVHRIRADPSQAGTVYVGLNDPQGENLSFGPGPLWQTTNDGTSWIMATRGHGPAFANDSTYWTSRGNPINGNMTFGHEPFNQQWGDNYPHRTMRNFDVNSRGDIMLISAHNTLLSTDRGATFTQVDEDTTPAGNLVGRGNSDLPGETLKQDPRLRPGELFLGSGEHRLWKTTLDDMNGRVAMKLCPAMDTVSSIALHPNDVNTVFVTSNRQHAMDEIWRSTDGGDTFSKWGDTTAAVTAMRTKALTIDPINPQYMYLGVTDRSSSDLGNPSGFYFSSDGGVNWSTRNTGLPADPRVNDMVFDPRDPSYQSIFIAAQKRTFGVTDNVGGLYHTSDRGQTWSQITVDAEVDGVNEIKIDQLGRLWITTGHRESGIGGLWYSDNYGTTWTKAFASKSTDSIDVSPFNPNLVVVSVSDISANPGVYLSQDRGVTWSKNNRVISINHRISAVEFSIHDPATLWLSCVGAGFFKGTMGNVESYKYDFGTANSPVQSGWTRISPSTATSDISWSAALNSVDRGTANGANDLTGDLVYHNSERTLQYRIANGTWHVTLTMGDASYPHDDMVVKAEGVVKASGIDSAVGHYTTVNFEVEVTDGFLTLAFSDGGGTDVNWVLNSMVLTQVKDLGIFSASEDVGTVGIAGTASHSSGQYVMNASGGGVDGSADAFLFASTYQTGDAEIVAAVGSVENTHEEASGGVMFRDGTADDAKFVMIGQQADGQVSLHWRTTSGSGSTRSTLAGGSGNKWLKLTRDGDLFSGYYSLDGEAWTMVGQVTVTLPSEALVGLAATSHDSGTAAEVIFNHVNLADPLGYFVRTVDVGAVAAAGTFTHAENAYVIEGSGSDIWGTADEFFFASQKRVGDADIIARVVDVENTNGWAKGGVMLRDSLTAGAKHVAVLARPDRQISMQWRSTTDEAAQFPGLVGGTANVKWVRLVRKGDTFSGYYSIDGLAWTLISTQTITMAANAELGLALTSHEDGTLSTGTFSNVSITNYDTDLDGVSDTWENANGYNPFAPDDFATLDSDGDRYTDVLELFQGTDKYSTDSHYGLQQTALSLPSKTLSTQYRRSTGATGLSSEKLWSLDLVTWHESGQTDGGVTVNLAEAVVESGAGYEIVEITATTTGGDAERLFLVLKLTPAE